MKEIKLVLTVEETNQILDALGNQPFKSVYGLIGKIQNQAASQLNENGAAPEVPKNEAEIKKVKAPTAK